MKVCCIWCQAVYEARFPERVKDPSYVYCSQGCLDADKLFKEYIKLRFRGLGEVPLLKKHP